MNVERRFLPPERASSEGNLKGSAPRCLASHPECQPASPPPRLIDRPGAASGCHVTLAATLKGEIFLKALSPLGPPRAFGGLGLHAKPGTGLRRNSIIRGVCQILAQSQRNKDETPQCRARLIHRDDVTATVCRGQSRRL
jgi:hypothetical protein